MSVKALSAVWEDSRAEGSQLLVLLAMADWADHNGRCYPSYTQIAWKARLSRASVAAAVKALVDAGEIERVPFGHAASVEQDDDLPCTVSRQRRNAYRILLLTPNRGTVDQRSNHLSTVRGSREVVQKLDGLKNIEVVQPLDQIGPNEVVQLLDYLPVQVVQTADGDGPNSGLEVVQSTDPHIRNSPSVLTVSRPSATAVVADEDIEALRLAWNDAIATDRTSKIPIVSEVTPARRGVMAGALVDRPLDAWKHIFAKVVASSFLGGGGERGWVINLWWLLDDQDCGYLTRAIDVLDGRYDDHFSDTELREASRQLFNAYGGRCPHTPPCGDDRQACARRHALAIRSRRAS